MARFLVSALAIVGSGVLLLGCGGGVPILHGAHALPQGGTTNIVGFSGVFTTGPLRSAVEAARSGRASSVANTEAKEEMVMAAIGPGVAPIVAMRLGLPGDNEVGVSYTGTNIRFDARHAFEDGPWALSLGAGANGAIGSTESTNSQSSGSRAGAFGFDVPVLFGWRSDAGVVSVWTGARGGLEHVGTSSSDGLLHWNAGGLAGLSMGFRHVHVSLALEASYHHVAGTFGGSKVEVHGLALTPAGGLLLTF